MSLKSRLKAWEYLAVRRVTGRIRSGPLQGHRWTVFAGSRFIRGTFEPEKTAALQAMLRDSKVFYDVGANAGYFSLLASCSMPKDGQIFAFEPSPVTWAYLQVNLHINSCNQVHSFRSAVGESSGTVTLDTHSGRGTHKVREGGDQTVSVVSLDGFIEAGHPVPDLVKIDVEGYEMSVLAGAENLLAKRRPKLVVAVHSPQLESDVRELLTRLGYRIETIVESKGDTELLATPS